MNGSSTDAIGIEFRSDREEDTLRLGSDVAIVLKPGDLLAISGELGSGKSVFCRGLIRHLASNQDLEVASPTYTLCNHYDTTPPVSHYDMYRLGSFEESEELGIDEALETGCALVEWPEKGLKSFPSCAVHIKLTETDENKRLLIFSGNRELIGRIARSIAIRKFLDECGHADAARTRLAADASVRRYELIDGDTKESFLLMDAAETPDGPPVRDGKSYSQIAHLAENVTAFVAIGNLLHSRKLGGPAISAYDLEQGFVLLEHMGSGAIIDADQSPIEDRYLLSVEYLAHLHTQKFPGACDLPDGTTYEIPRYDNAAMMIEADLLLDWYAPAHSIGILSQDARDEFKHLWHELFAELETQEHSLVLRDYHSPNIIWRSDREGLQRIGVIDYQDALIGPSAYDVASLAQDARVNVSPRLQDQLLDHYLELRNHNNATFDSEAFRAGFAIMAAQRATKILGIFVRLDQRDGKPQYLQHMPRVQAYLQRSLQHPVLSRYRQWIKSVIEL